MKTKIDFFYSIIKVVYTSNLINSINRKLNVVRIFIIFNKNHIAFIIRFKEKISI